MTIVIALIIFMLVVLLHEFGHFIVAKKSGIKVNEFSVGMGPALFQRKKGETVYSLRVLPLGGYCAMEGEDEESPDPASYDLASPSRRFFTILAGPLMNLLVAYVCFALFLGINGKPIAKVANFSEDSPLLAAGAKIGDEVTALNGDNVENYDDMINQLQKKGKDPLKVTIYRVENGQGKSIDLELKASENGGKYFLGFYADRESDFLYAIVGGFTTLVENFKLLFVIIGRLITGKLSMGAVSGPIGVVKMIGDAANQSFAYLVFLTGYISLNLGFFNLLPIPALDGSKLIFIAIEKIRGKAIKKETESKITMAGFAFLMGILVLVSIKDVVKLF